MSLAWQVSVVMLLMFIALSHNEPQNKLLGACIVILGFLGAIGAITVTKGH